MADFYMFYLFFLVIISVSLISLHCAWRNYPDLVTIRDYEPHVLKELVMKYLETHHDAWTDEIADAIQADVFEVNKVLHELEKEGVVH